MKLSLLIIVLLFASCAQQSTFTEEEQKQVVSEVKQMMQHYCDDVRAHGLTAEFKYLDSSDDFYWIPPGYDALIPYDSIARILKQNAPLTKSIDNKYNDLRITPVSESYAIYVATVTSTNTDTAGKQSTYYLIENGTVVKRKDGWKLLCGHTSMVSGR